MYKILFRGRRVDNGEWVESHSIVYSEMDDGSLRVELGAGNATTMVCDAHDNVVEECAKDGCLTYTVHEESVGAYTGIHDANGKKIFDKDIVTLNGVVKIVCWSSVRARWELNGGVEGCIALATAGSVRVVGNTFDIGVSLDPKLLRPMVLAKRAREGRGR